MTLQRAVELLTSRHVGGLLVAVPLNGLDKELGADYARLADGLVLVGQSPLRGAGMSAAEVGDAHGGMLVGQHRGRLGWRRLAYIAGPERNRAARRRLAGFRRGLEGAGAGSRLVAVAHDRWSAESGRLQARELRGARRRPNAIFAANDLIALGVVQAAAELGLRIGADLGLVGDDDIETVRHLEVPLTSVAPPKRELVRRAAELLLARARMDGTRQRARLRPELVLRESCGAGRDAGRASRAGGGA